MINDKDNQEEEVLEDLPEVEEGQEDTTDYKALAKKNHGIAQRYQTKLKKLKEEEKEKKEEKKEKKEEKKPEEKKPEKKETLDRIDKAVIKMNGITEPEEVEMVEKAKKESGKSVEEILEASWFKSELKEFRENVTSLEATPKGSKRANQGSRDSVEYWIKKGELPPTNQVDLRRKVVNARMKKEKQGNVFTDTPVV